MLRGECRVIVQTRWDGEPADALIALHARRSASSVEDFRAKRAQCGIAVVLTGTDLYRDLPGNSEATRCLDRADRIVALQDLALRSLSREWRAKASVIHQSAPSLRACAKARDRLDCVVAGHLRDVKDPATVFDAFRELSAGLPIRLRHFGAPLDERLAAHALSLQAADPRYRYLGARSHRVVREAIRAAHLLIHPSLMEGGANVIVEAVTSGTPVLASRIPGNVGMLGSGYAGYFESGDARALAKLLRRTLDDRLFLARLRAQCGARRPLFAPAAEARAVRRLARALVG
jgi:putative glycosyltransferase (TIGR04348 family)